MGRNRIKPKSHKGLFDFLIEALRAEAMTSTGRINITATVLLGACLLIIIPVKGTEVIAATILSSLGKQPPELIPPLILYILAIGTFLFFALCLWVVRDMELKKQQASQKTKDSFRR